MLNDFQQKIFKMKYAKGEETWEDACLRVATHVASAELLEGGTNHTEYTAKFFQLMYEGVFLPGGRVLANSGTNIENLMNCFVLPIEDSRESIYNTLGDAAEIFAWGGGLGFNFSNLRERGSEIRSTGGKSCGPLPFMVQFDTTGDVIHQASRRGAQMGVLNVDHPDILEFISYKSKPSGKFGQAMSAFKKEINFTVADELLPEIGYIVDEKKARDKRYVDSLERVLSDKQLTHFNLSVGITDKFMDAVKSGEDWELISPLTGGVASTISARKLLSLIAESSWKSGDPGVLFLDRVNEDNMVPSVGRIEATNPCGEVPLLPNESCCLGSLNLASFWDSEENKFNFEFYEYAIRTAIRFLDNVQTLSKTPNEEINRTSKSFRRLGLGVMGFADLLAEMEIPYDSSEAINLAERLSWFLSFFSWSESMVLAEERGTFDGFDALELDQEVLLKSLESVYVKDALGKLNLNFREGNIRVRNISVTSIAPTGTISLLAGVNSAIEPIFSLHYTRNITSGVDDSAVDTQIVSNPILIRKLRKYGFTDEQISNIRAEIVRTGSIQHIKEIPQKLRAVFKTAHELSWKAHVDIQASWQKYITNAVSKTINMPNSVRPRDIYNAFIYMWESGLKGGTIYRDGSKGFQILNK